MMKEKEERGLFFDILMGRLKKGLKPET